MGAINSQIKFTGHSLEHENNVLYKVYGYLQIAFLWILFVPIVILKCYFCFAAGGSMMFHIQFEVVLSVFGLAHRFTTLQYGDLDIS